MTTPPFHTTHINYQEQQLFVEQLAVNQLAQSYKTPLYIYSKATLLDAVKAYQTALSAQNHLICYSVKANSNIAILQLLAHAGCGFDIVSGGELQRALAAGAQPQTIVFSGVGKTQAEMQMALKAGIKCFNVESIAELEVLAKAAKELSCQAPISLRVNPDIDAKTHPYISTGLKNNKFGIAFDKAFETYVQASKYPELKIVGVDCHIGSQITEIQPYLDALDKLIMLIKQLESAGISLEHLDLGGGLGITYQDEIPPTPQSLYTAIIERLHQSNLQHIELVVEPGRSIVAHAGILVTEVLYLKPGETKNFCIVDAALNDLYRPAMYDAYHSIIEVKKPKENSSTSCYDVVGPICESSDFLGRDRNLSVEQGELLAVLAAGAYGKSMASNYNSRPCAPEILVDGETAHVIADRTDLTALYKNEHLIP